MTLTQIKVKQALNKAYLKEKVTRANIELFKKNLVEFLNGINEKESEEYVKNLVTKFLYDTYYNGKNQINTKGRIDLAIYEDKKPVVILEAKKPGSMDMVTTSDINKKATHELILYYLQERVDHGNIDIKYLIITNTREWFIFDASVFDTLFYKNSGLMKDFTEWKNGQKARTDRDLFYNDIARPFLKNSSEEIKFTWFDVREFEKFAKNDNPKDDVKLIDLYKVLSPAHLLKQPFANDSNSLDTKFYSELLHLIGLEEKKEGGKKIIQRKEKPEVGSLLENTINILVTEERLLKLKNNAADFGNTKEERLFNVALELCITWINRILFLKLLEGQLVKYHKGDKRYRFLDFKTIPNYDELNKLFFQVLARKHNERTGTVKEKFDHVPYLNSSLFDISALEDDTLRINSLDESVKLKIGAGTVLKTENGKKREGELPTLQYLFEFLDAYDFASEGNEEIQEENKSIINASVLGLIFEKINGYKDGSFFTPGFITMYMCRETIRRAVVQKFNEAKDWKVESFNDLYNHIKDVKEANEIINSLKICDPAVGSGHFLVSALNEIIAIKSELGVLVDRQGKRLRDYAVEVINDELIISLDQHELFEYKPANKESQRVQEALFHEKQTIIENCLFGVDINPNSVKICRLRLWIELLKNAYYTENSKYTQLETLPNIDINIKQGNSLISRFPLDADLSKALKSIKYNIDDYRSFVNSYKNATDKEAKRGFEKLIEQIKKDFRTEIGKNDPKVMLMNKRSGELYNLLNQARVFEPSEKEKKEQNKKKEKLEAEINKLAAEIEEIKSSAIYKDAFEWRFEFPEVLDNEGNYTGFDIFIGNPPYGIQIDKLLEPTYKRLYPLSNYKINLYTMFIERFTRDLAIKNRLLVSFIIPKSLLFNSYFKNLRKHLLEKTNIRELVNCDEKIFEEAEVGGSLIMSVDATDKVDENNVLRIINAISFTDGLFQENAVKQNTFLTGRNYDITATHESANSILAKLSSLDRIDIHYDLKNGLNPGNVKHILISRKKTTENHKPIIWGKDINRFRITWSGDYINYDPSLKDRISVADTKSKSGMNKQNKIDFALRTPNLFERNKIVLRKTGDSIIAALDTDHYYFDTLVHGIYTLEEQDGYTLEYLLAILNSRFATWLYRSLHDVKGKAFAKIGLDKLAALPIPAPDKKLSSIIVDSVKELASLENLDTEASLLKKLDELVYLSYGLTDEEIKSVETNS
jgi:adenine-specific DNA-methyltransferase